MENNHIDADELEEIIKNLPQDSEASGDGISLLFYQKFWIPKIVLKELISFQKHYVANDQSEIILASGPKSGTTWLKALSYSIVNRNRFPATNSPLLKANPHDLVPFINYADPYTKSYTEKYMSEPRIFCTHAPYSLFPESLKTSSNCKIVYIYRNPMDVFVSLWNFMPNFRSLGKNTEPRNLEQCFHKFFRGISIFGPVWDHVLEFVNASLERPQDVLVLKYEDLKEDVDFQAKKLAEFLGFPFSLEEEENGVVQEITSLCSLERLKNLEINKIGKTLMGFPNSSFFRKGEVGDSKNVLSESMIEHACKILKDKYGDSISNFM